MSTPLLIVALSPAGAQLGQRITARLGYGEVCLSAGRTSDILAEAFVAGRPLICIMALGIVVRLLGPLTRDKTTESAVVVVDEAGRFAVSVLGGHAGGANRLTTEVASAVGAQPVITTASDTLGLPAIDLIGRSWGWKIEPGADLTGSAAAVIRGEPVAVYQESGRRDWWREFGEWPATFTAVTQWPPPGLWSAQLAISHRQLSCAGQGDDVPTVIYRPPVLVLGVGCKRGVPSADIETAFQALCCRAGLGPLSLASVATADLKANEPGLREFAVLYDVPLCAYSLAELAQVRDLPTPSQQVYNKLGVWGVAEPAALRAALSPGERGASTSWKDRGLTPSARQGWNRLLVPKQRFQRGITMALALKDES